jgi:Zn-dependent protease/predicted transcriptional regulator
MPGSLRLGRILGLEIEVHYSWFIVFALFALSLANWYFPQKFPSLPIAQRWLLGVIGSLALFGSLLLHEMAHSVVAQANGIKISGITLFLFGGVSRMTDEPPSAAVEFKVAVAGPATSIALAIVFWAVAVLVRAGGGHGPVLATLWWLAIINLVLAAFNLVPGFPLDGGRLLRALIWYASGNLRRASRIASWFGQGVGYLLIAWGVLRVFQQNWLMGIWGAFIGWFLIDAARAGYQQVIVRRMLSGVPVSRIMTTDVQVVPADISILEAVNGHFLVHHFSAFPVVAEGMVTGLIGLREIREVPREQWAITSVSQVMRPVSAEDTLSPDDDAVHALRRMTAGETAGPLLVMAEGQLSGIITRTDLMAHLRARLELDL